MADRSTPLTTGLSGENIAALDRLVRAVDMAEGFALFFARCNVPGLSQQLIGRARQQLGALGVTVVEVPLEGGAVNLRARLRQVLQPPGGEATVVAAVSAQAALEPVLVREPVASYSALARRALFVLGLEYSIPYDRPDARALAELNLGRDWFRRDVAAPVVFWLPDYAVTAIARHAPDFWAWRSGVFEFVTDDDERRAAVAQFVHEGPRLAALSNLPPAAKLARRRQLESLLDDYRDLPDGDRTKRERMAILSDLGRACYAQGDFPMAVDYYRQALVIARHVDAQDAEADAQRSIADVLRLTGRPQEAMSLYEESLHTKKALGDTRAVAVTQSKMADVLSQIGRPQEAMALYEESLRTIQALGDTREVAVTQSSMADVLSQMGRPQEAMALYEESLRTKKALGDTREVAVTQSKMADVLRQMGRPQEAMALYEESLRTIQALGDTREVAVTQSNMADVLSQMGRPQEAMALYEESLRTIQALGDTRGVAVTQSKMADVFSQMGRPQEAMALYEESLRTIQALGDTRAVAVTQSKMADVLSQIGRPQEAMALYEESLRTKKALGDTREVAVTQSSMADVLSQMGRPQEAMALYEESLRTKKALGDTRAVAVTQSKMADVLRQMGRPQEAMALYEESLRTIQALGDTREVAVTEANYGQFLLQQGEHARSLPMLWDSAVLLDRCGFAGDAETMRQILTVVKTSILKTQRFDQLWRETIAQPQPDWLREPVQIPGLEPGGAPS